MDASPLIDRIPNRSIHVRIFEKKKKEKGYVRIRDSRFSILRSTQTRTCKKLASKGTVESILKNA